MDPINRKVQIAEQQSVIDNMFLAGQLKKSKTAWDLATEKDEPPASTSGKQPAPNRNHDRPELGEVLSVREAKSAAKLFD
ncbi:hypothetical protein SS50377_26259 [Spironucleus salmonicida]|uniref:Uncharacterized protein n=1 Tax=Spironucleus salmonicida TaxID=348837 RepID=V6LWK7_9EUKA|nr:hypothetical protein SS50377_26248 [Spironucleus salmonicida]KAH0572056.1 hypothetical protein SS50377_26259 [Spironucleus salmonicida]|eukprot:EST44358.1 Hypothetical protein SS50377_15786 [Spironucleus salmonicida]